MDDLFSPQQLNDLARCPVVIDSGSLSEVMPSWRSGSMYDGAELVGDPVLKEAHIAQVCF